MAPYERFGAWQASHRLALAAYRLTATWPASERYGLTSQVRRAAASVPTNLAEGAAKRGAKEFRRFLDISLGSLSELTYLLRLGRDLGYLSTAGFTEIEMLRNEAGRLVWGLYRSISPRC